MSYFSWLRSRTSNRAPRNRALQRPAPRCRPRLEALEDRTLPSSYFAATTSDLIADIKAANQGGGPNTITLTAPTTSPYVLTAADNSTNGANGLPVISGPSQEKIKGKKVTVAADNLTIIGNGDIIERSTAAGTPAFRLFDVAAGGSLTLENLTLQGGLAFGSGAAANGGAVYNQGTLTLSGATVQGNTARGIDGFPGAGADAAGGGIWSNGTVKLEGGTIIGGAFLSQANVAQGGRGGPEQPSAAGAGGGGFGGGLYQAGGDVTMSNATLIGNQALGGTGGYEISISGYPTTGNGGAASGGGLFVASGTLVMSNDTVEYNTARGGNGGSGDIIRYLGTGGTGSGGGVYVGGGTVTLQTVQLLSNSAQGGDGGEYYFTEGVTAGAIISQRGKGGSGLGGGLYVGGGTVTLTGDTVTGNGAYAAYSGNQGVPTDSPGVAAGGGIDIAPHAKVSLDSFTVTNTTKNDDYQEDPLMRSWYPVGEDDIDGSYTLT